MSRGVTPAIGVVILLLVTVTLAASAGMVLSMDPAAEPPTTQLSATVTGDEISITHERGDPLDVNELEIFLEVNGTALEHQPPVPFFAADGFEGGPTGPFNTESSDNWRAGETGSFALAGTNEPQIHPESAVTVTVSTEDVLLFEKTLTPDER